MMWFTKSRRAQTNDDYETWNEGGVTPTLNIFDNGGDTRATVLILMRWREGKPGGGKGALLSENKSLTLGTGNDQVLFEPIGFSHTQGLDAQPSTTVFPTLRKNGAGMAVAESANAYSIREDANANTFSATPIETSRALQAQQPSVQSHHAQTFIAQVVTNPKNCHECATHITSDFYYSNGDISAICTNCYNGQPAQPLAFDGYNQTLNTTTQTIRSDKSDGDHVGMVMNQTIVRRLTPIECERLQGFPDNWTANRIDVKNGGVVEQKDSARYKQMGNAVAVPVAQWLLNRIISAYHPDETPAQSQAHPTPHH